MNVEDTYIITLLPEDNALKQLNDVKNYFYANNFKFKHKVSTSNSHITVSECKAPGSWKKFKEDFPKTISSLNAIQAKVQKITDEIKITENHPDGEGWVALLFDDNNIKKLFNKLENYLDDQKISLNNEYIDAIKTERGKKLEAFDCIANHLNLCNHCRPEKAKEAKDYVEKNISKEITFDKIVVRHKNSEEEITRYYLPNPSS